MKRRKAYTPYLFLLPALAFMGVFLFYPIVDVFRLSFTNYNMITEAQFVGLENYNKLFNEPLFWKTLKNSFIYLIGVVPILVVAPIFLAILVNNKLKGIKWFRAAYYIPVVTSMVVVGIMWKWLYQGNGILNYVLQSLGIINNQINWLTDPGIALFSVMAVTVWKGLGYYMVIYLSGLQSIPQELYEVSEIDGASWWQKHIHVTIPLLRPSIMLVTILSSIAAMKVFTEVYVMTKGGPLNSSKTLVYYIYQMAFENLNLGYAAAMGFVLFIIIFILSFFNIKLMDQGSR
ncbi:carbohydrate ABC transporter permease [Halanaerobium saccharolyticum]|jgi:putative chitobiose transport system permease protein|uniref:Carbohydrate ABC transporter membrane protein 1 (CUT1 family) n=1 Tax=Halanaerobium saccharolyticum TaxID=43595 RepID=A0A4R6SGF6_9FIRM|nr:sugar ABC transporter permease [Halanaerobium saccharolyticum]TDP98206.1 carbohydrate ABC transporter membrane protein 1 (CUT1 family) [Halanaerobium saccharolyticum]